MIRIPTLILATLLLCGSGNGWAINLYQIGNSLTLDSQPLSTQGMADSIGLDFYAGWHIRSASTIRDIWNNPTTSASHLSRPGPTWQTPLSDLDWDALVLQPHNQPGNTMAIDLSYAENFIDHARSTGSNGEMDVYILSTYPNQEEGWSNWITPVPDTPTQLTIHRRGYFENVASNLATTLGQPVRIVPTGDVLYRITQEIELGTVPNVDSISDLYRDDIHASNLGRLASSSAVFATITGRSPVGLPTTVYTSAPDETVLRIQQIAWEVVSQHPHSGVILADGDYNGDGVVNLADYTLWRDNIGAPAGTLSNDPNDTPIGAAQYQTWKQNFGSYASSGVTRNQLLGATAVPEPGSSVMLIGGVLGLLAWTIKSWRVKAA